jgi:hypothetical protein
MEARKMFTKKNLRKEIDAKLERKTPHLEAYEKTPAPVVRKKMGWLAPVLSLSLSAVFLLGSSFLIVHLIRNHPNSGSEQATGELASSQVQETGTNGQSDPSLTFYTENHGYFSLSSAEASKKELALDAALNDGKQNEAQVQISFFVGFQGLNGDSLYEGNNSAFSGKTLRAITSSATLKCEEGGDLFRSFFQRVHRCPFSNRVSGKESFWILGLSSLFPRKSCDPGLFVFA